MSPSPVGFAEQLKVWAAEYRDTESAMKLNSELLQQAEAELSSADPILAKVIKKVGSCRIKRVGGGYEVLVRSILSQQISTAAARTVLERLVARMPNGKLSADAISQLSDDVLQATGISRQKRSYLRDLTQKTLDGTINFRVLSRLDDESAISTLVQVKGVGRWTAQMFLMFWLERPDIFAPDDLGLQNACTHLYGLGDRVSPRELSEFSKRWSPWRTVAAWYLWRSLEK